MTDRRQRPDRRHFNPPSPRALLRKAKPITALVSWWADPDVQIDRRKFQLAAQQRERAAGWSSSQSGRESVPAGWR